jgi:cyanophycinase
MGVSLASASSPAKPIKLLQPGKLLLCGGNRLPDSILETFYRLGGAENGNLVIVPTASPRSESKEYSRWIQMWDAYPWKSVSIVNADSREQACQEDLVELIRNASAVWIAGGDQQRLVDRYHGTPVYAEILKLLERDAIVGGTSAGSAIASHDMIADGESIPVMKAGWGVLPEVIVDQHFSQRNRFGRLSLAVQQNPKRIGVGIDESTGMLIDRNGVQVLGDGAIHVFQVKPNAEVVTDRTAAGSSIPKANWQRLTTWGPIQTSK